MNRIQNPEEAAGEFLKVLRQSRSAVGLTGAGVSTGSGIPDFRGPSGLYSKLSPRTFEIDFFLSCPDEYYQIAIEHIHPLADRETVYEWFYKFYLTPWCILTPDLQVITNPGGDKDDRDAVVAGLRLRIIF